MWGMGTDNVAGDKTHVGKRDRSRGGGRREQYLTWGMGTDLVVWVNKTLAEEVRDLSDQFLLFPTFSERFPKNKLNSKS